MPNSGATSGTQTRAQFAIIGHKVRMGNALANAIEEAAHDFKVGVDIGGHPGPVVSQCDVVVA